MSMLPGLLLRVEGAAVAMAAVVLYFDGGHPWWLFVVLILAPDLSMVGYLAGARVGALTYNLAHTSVWAVVLVSAGVLAGSAAPLRIGLIWAAHIGVDRALGFGLKYPSAFKDTHLQRV